MYDVEIIQTAFKEQIVAIRAINNAMHDIIQDVKNKGYLNIKYTDKKSIQISVSGNGASHKIILEYNKLCEDIFDFDTIYTDQSGLELRDKIIHIIKDKLIKSVNNNASNYI